jgi:hypothetical protein
MKCDTQYDDTPNNGTQYRVWLCCMSFMLSATNNYFKLKNVWVFELQSIQIIECNLAIWLIESMYYKLTKAFQITEFQNCQNFILSIQLIDFQQRR